MKTLLITGHDTGIGKTWVTQYIANKLCEHQHYVQVVKPVETGIDPSNSTQTGDVTTVLNHVTTSNSKFISGFTLNSFKAPLAPLSAATLENSSLSLNHILNQINQLPQTDWRIIETAGGIAVPLDPSGADGRDLAIELQIDFIVLVIHNRLGAINQARLLNAYTPKNFAKIGFWLNDVQPHDPLVTESNLAGLKSVDTPLWAHQEHQALQPKFCTAPFLFPNPGEIK